MSRLMPFVLVAAALLAGCAAETPDLRNRQERACAAATAGDVGRDIEAVTPTWRGRTERGTAEVEVEVREGNRLHVCEVDASARPLSLEHPAA